MKKFILKITTFIVVIFVLLGLIMLLPATPRAKESFLFSEHQKDSLLIHVPSPRIIFIGGSNFGFGLNSQTIKDSLHLNPINTAIGIGLGLKYMLDHNSQYIREGDIVVLSPEYQHFFNDYNYGSKEVLRIVLDVNRSNIRLLNLKQMLNCTHSIGYFIFSKLNPMEYINLEEKDNIYGVDVYNQFGDAALHWTMERRAIKPFKAINPESYNPEVMNAVKEYAQKIHQKGAVLLLTYPACQDISFYRSIEAIEKVREEMEKNNFKILGTPERYILPDSLLFEAPYHLNKQGVDRRTSLLLEDIGKLE